MIRAGGPSHSEVSLNAIHSVRSEKGEESCYDTLCHQLHILRQLTLRIISISLLITISPWLRQKTDHSCGPIDFYPLTVAEFRHKTIDADHTGLSVFACNHRAVLKNTADLK